MTASARLPDWPQRLAAVMTAAAGRPFEWGAHDCGLFAGACVQAVTGRDPRGPFAGRYTTARQAQRLIQAHGGLAALAGRTFGPEVPPALAQPGDVGLVHWSGKDLLAVWGGNAWHAPGPQGLACVPAAAARRCWRPAHG